MACSLISAASWSNSSFAGLASVNSALMLIFDAAGTSATACPHDDVLAASEIAGSMNRYFFFIVFVVWLVCV